MLAGLIIVVVMAAGLAYVIMGLKRSGDAEAWGVEPGTPIGDAVVVVRPGETDIEDEIGTAEVSTPLLREAARHELALQAKAAVRRRRQGLLVAAAASVGVIVGAVALRGVSAWWALAAPAPLLIWAIAARVSVHVRRATLNQRLEAVDTGWDEETSLISVEAEPPVATPSPRSEMSVELSVPLKSMPSLLEPLAVAPATYVSKPLMPRSVRTIDLSSPQVQAAPDFPISADCPQDVLPFDMDARAVPDDDSGELPFAVGE